MYRPYLYLLGIIFFAITILYGKFYVFNRRESTPEKNRINGTLINMSYRNMSYRLPNGKFQLSIVYILKHVATSRRYERNKEIRTKLQRIISKINGIRNIFMEEQGHVDTSNITLLFNTVNEVDVSTIKKILKEVSKNKYKNVRSIIAFKPNTIKDISKLQVQLPLSVFISTDSISSHRQILIRMLEAVTTTYVVVCRDIFRFNSNFPLKQLIDPLLRNQSDVVGSGHKNRSGHWKLGCYQTNMLWYRYRLVEGYDASYNNYAYCDYISGPFSATRTLLMQHIDSVSNDLNGDALYVDFMMSLKKAKSIVMSCIDCIFNTKTNNILVTSKEKWQPFMRKYTLNQIMFPYGEILQYSCSDIDIGCSSPKGSLLPLCCYRELQDLAKFTTNIYKENGIEYELDAGSALGSVKLDGTLLWEKDHDFNLRTDHIKKLLSLTSVFQQAGYGVHEKTVDYEECRMKLQCGYVGVTSTNWRMEMWGIHVLSGDIYFEKERIIYETDNMGNTSVKGNITLSRLDNVWVPVYSNPGAFSRGHYGVDILQHSQHWMDLGKSTSWIVYKPGRWGTCNNPSFHGCANNFLGDGNLQFRDVWV